MPGSVLLCHAGLHPAMQFVCKHLLMTLIDDVLGHVCHFQGVWGLLGVSGGGWGDGQVHFALGGWGWFGLCWSVQVMLLMMALVKCRRYFWRLAGIKVSAKIFFFCKNNPT